MVLPPGVPSWSNHHSLEIHHHSPLRQSLPVLPCLSRTSPCFLVQHQCQRLLLHPGWLVVVPDDCCKVPLQSRSGGEGQSLRWWCRWRPWRGQRSPVWMVGGVAPHQIELVPGVCHNSQTCNKRQSDMSIKWLGEGSTVSSSCIFYFILHNSVTIGLIHNRELWLICTS